MFKSSLCLFFLCWVSASSFAGIEPRDASPAGLGSSLRALPKPSIDNVIDRAYALLGTPYRLGGASVGQGFDCSGLLVYLFKTEANILLPRTTAAMHRSTAATVKRDALRPGDAVFFKGNGRGQVSHVGLYIGDGKFIHSPRTGKNIRIDSLTNRYWKRNYTTAKRFHAMR
ncbi:peptidoglycan endopeptidase [Pseudomonas sp. CCM 7891]|uniref:Peptidoglycan endopeptidase n=1 Tax=Pseudomonas karstica TaxID=1055468 RepID=A0A7X2RXY1_9PSED|nr:C40 family peptidase [Pseudomonas karstica]MTD22491.1 peptidoglycan endopeptidase [Pseudomonas karstica]